MHFLRKCRFSLNSNQWKNRQKRDAFAKKAKMLQYRARSAFKLIEINEKKKILAAGQTIIELGSSPGGWTQVLVEKTKKNDNLIVAVDKLAMKPVKGAHFIHGDFTDKDIQNTIIDMNKGSKADLIVSDMCPEFSGERMRDHASLIQLNVEVVKFAKIMLKTEGILVLKTFDGSMTNKLKKALNALFGEVFRLKPVSSRAESSEFYYVCRKFTPKEESEDTEITKSELTEEDKVFNKVYEVYCYSEEYKKLFADFDSVEIEADLEKEIAKLKEETGVDFYNLDQELLKKIKLQARRDQEEMQELRKEYDLEQPDVDLSSFENFKADLERKNKEVEGESEEEEFEEYNHISPNEFYRLEKEDELRKDLEYQLEKIKVDHKEDEYEDTTLKKYAEWEKLLEEEIKLKEKEEDAESLREIREFSYQREQHDEKISRVDHFKWIKQSRDKHKKKSQFWDKI